MKLAKITALSALGSALEYFDFVSYAMLMGILNQVFFPKELQMDGFIVLLTVMASGYLARPIGGYIWGKLGDRFGRSRLFPLSIIFMGIATFAIGLLPGFRVWGIYSVYLLLALRILQGIAFGAELPGAITYLMEHVSNPKQQSWHASWLYTGLSIGALLSSFCNYLLSRFLTSEQLLSFGWRIPFLVGGVLAFLGFIMRRYSPESPLFLELSNAPRLLIKTRSLIKPIVAAAVISLSCGTFVIFSFFLPSYLQTYFHYPLHEIYLSTMVSFIWVIFLIPLMAKLADSIGRVRLMGACCAIIVVTIYPLFTLLKGGTPTDLYLFMLIYQVFIAVISASYPPLLAELFPTQTRYMGIGIAYNLAYSIAGCIPLLSALLINLTHHVFAVVFPFALVSILTIFILWRFSSYSFKAV